MTRARDISKLISGDSDDGLTLPSGTTAQRGSQTGQIRFNSTTGLAEYYDGTNFKSIDNPPTVTSIDDTEVDSQAGGNQTIVITGSNFNSGATVTFVGANGTNFDASTVTVDSLTQITAVAPKSSFLNAQEPYGVKVTNVSGSSATLQSQINVDNDPSWQTASGSLGTINDYADNTHATVSATDPDGDTVSYSETASVLSNAGMNINSSTGVISGNPNNVTSSTTLSFTLRATANTKTADRAFSIIVNPAGDGSSSTRAGTSAQAIKTLTGTTTNGTYWIKPTGVSTAYQAYCNMNIDGGVILGAKLEESASYWHYDSNLWTSNNNYNSSSLNANSANAKLQPAQDFPANYLYVVNHNMTKWVRFDLASQTTGFHNIWAGNNTSFSVTGSTVGTHVSATPPIDTDESYYFDADGGYTVSGEDLADFDTEDWGKEAYVGAYGGGEGRVRLGKIRWNDPGPWEGVHTTSRGLGHKGCFHNSGTPSDVSFTQKSVRNFQMMFLR